MQPILLGIDIGTSGCKVQAMDTSCRVLTSAVTEYPLYTPALGWTEQNPSDWWEAACRGIRTLMPSLSSYRIAGIGLSGQMHGMVALDSAGSVVRPAILWNDQRTSRQCEEILSLAGGVEGLSRMTNNHMLTGFTAGKILWMKENEPDLFRRVVRIVNPKDYIAFRLTGVLSTDVSDASGTGLYDVKNNRFSTELLSLLDLSPDLFAPVHASSEVIGTVSEAAAALTGIPAGTPVTAGGGDAVLSTIAMGAGDDRTLAVMVGTSGVVSLHTDTFFPNPKGTVQFSRACVDGLYHVMGVTLAAAGSYKWYGDLFGNGDYRGMDEAAASAPAGAKGLLFLPYLFGERCPVNDSAARGAFIGLTASHTKADFNRAVLEGVVYSLRQVYENVRPHDRFSRLILAGGGSKSPLWRQIFADVFGLEAVTLDGAGEGSGFGASIVAAVGCGLIPSIAEATARLKEKTLTHPLSENRAVYEEAYRRYLSLYGRLKDLYR